MAVTDEIKVRIGFDAEAKDRFMRDIEEIRLRLISLAREQKRVLDNAERLRADD